MKRSRALRLAAVVLACAATPAAARGQSPEEVLRRVAARTAEAARGVENYTLVLGVTDDTVTLYTSRGSPSDPFRVQFGARGQVRPSMALPPMRLRFCAT